MNEAEVDKELEWDLNIYGSCYWKVIDGKKVRIAPADVRFDRDGVPRDDENSMLTWGHTADTGGAK